MNLTSDQKAALYNEGIRRYNLLDEKIREIKSKSFEVSDVDMKEISKLEEKKRYIFNQTQKLHNS